MASYTIENAAISLTISDAGLVTALSLKSGPTSYHQANIAFAKVKVGGTWRNADSANLVGSTMRRLRSRR
jgi:hypothetical protein